MAAGLTVDRERLDALRLFLDEKLGGTVEAAAAERILPVDGVMTAGGATTAFVEDVERAGPFGSGSPEPVSSFRRTASSTRMKSAMVTSG